MTELEKQIKKMANKAEIKMEKLLESKLLFINKQIEEIDKRYKGMFSHLVSVFLVKLEQRIYENSIAVVTLQQLMIENYASMMNITYDEAKDLMEDKFANVAEKLVEADKIEQEEKEDE